MEPLTSLVGMLTQALKLHSTFPALCWLVLNQLVFMSYLEARHRAGWWTSLESATRAALIVLVALLIGYTLDSLNFILLGLFEGEDLRSTWWGQLMIAWYRGRRERLKELAQLPGSDQKFYELAKRFPPDPYRCAPTALGNLLTASKVRVLYRYGIDAGYMWPHLMAVLSEKGYAAQVEREKAALYFCLNLSVLSGFFVVECVLARMWLGWAGPALVPWAAVGVAYVFYRLAIPCAEKWYDWINAAFDLYRYQLAERLALEPFKDREDETGRWRAISYFIKHGRWDDFRAFCYPLPGEKEVKAGGEIVRPEAPPHPWV
jgi:hypothetical protein